MGLRGSELCVPAVKADIADFALRPIGQTLYGKRAALRARGHRLRLHVAVSLPETSDKHLIAHQGFTLTSFLEIGSSR